MLASTLGIRLILWLGRTVPTPAPLAVLNALTNVEVTNDASQGDGFQMTFSLSKELTGDYDLLSGGALAPLTRVIVGVVMGVTPEVLIDGIITHHQLTPSNDPGQSTLTVTGRDVSTMLDLHERNDSYPNQPDSVIVLRLLASYAQYGLAPQITPTTDVPLIIDHIPRQQETDLRFIQRLAQRNGFVFYIEPLTFGVNTAYWGPETRLGLPQPALTVHMGSFTNVKTLNFSNDALAPVSTESSIQEPLTRLSIPIPSLPALRLPPLAGSPAPAQRSVILRESANQNAAEAVTAAVAAATRAPDAVSGDGELEAVRYGSVLRARRVVGLRGAGTSYDGNYYVRRVTHVIAAGEYTQRFTISREGTGSLLPVVRP